MAIALLYRLSLVNLKMCIKPSVAYYYSLDMRKSGKWMTIVDDRVLEYISENGHGSPTEMMENGPIPYSRGYITQRCQKLADHGLLQPVGNGVYTITARGEAYLAGDLDTHEDAPDEAPDAAETPTGPDATEADDSA